MTRPPDPAASPVPWQPAPDTPLGEIEAHWLADRAAFTPPSLILASELFYQAGRYGRASEFLCQYLGEVPGDAAQQVRLAACLRQGGDISGAEAALNAAVAIDADLVEAWGQLRALLLGRGDVIGALHTLEREAVAAGDTPARLMHSGRLLMHLRRLHEGDSMLARIGTDQPELFLDASRLRAQAKLNLGLYDDAVTVALAGLALAPDDMGLNLSLAQGLIQRGAFSRALPALDAVLRQDAANAPLLRQRSEVLIQLNRLKAALADALAAAELDPGHAEYVYHAAGVAARLGHADQSLALLRHAASLQLGSAEIWLALARQLADRGQPAAGVAALDEAAQHLPGDHRLQQLRLTLLERERDPPLTGMPIRPLRPLPRSRDPRHLPEHGMQVLLLGLRVQVRVLAALVGREIHHLSQYSRFGLASVVIEPILHITVLGIALHYFNRAQPPLGSDLFFYYATGIVPFLLFGHITEHALNTFRDNVAILQVPLIRRTDLLLGVAAVHTLVDGIAFTLILIGMILMGRAESIHDWWLTAAAFLTTALLGLGFGMVGGALNAVSRVVQKIWYSAQRLLYLLSGVFYLPMLLPTQARDILVWNPMLQCIEFVRHGIFPDYEPPWLSPRYILIIALGLLLLGLIIERPLRRYAQI